MRWWAALAITVCVAYAPALKAPFVFDDVVSIVDNASIRRVWPPSVPLQPPSGGFAVSGRPVANYTLAMNYAVNDLLGVDQRAGSPQPAQAAGYRIVNVALHLLCGMLLFGIIVRTLRSAPFAAQWAGDADAVALIISALWLLHPIQTEAVDYVVQRTELIVSACWLGTLYASIRAWDAGRRWTTVAWYATAVVVCLLGMGSKEVMISAPLMVMLYDRAFRAASWRELFVRAAVCGFTCFSSRRASGRSFSSPGVLARTPWDSDSEFHGTVICIAKRGPSDGICGSSSGRIR